MKYFLFFIWKIIEFKFVYNVCLYRWFSRTTKKTNVQKYFNPSSLTQPFLCAIAHVQCREPQKHQQKDPIFKEDDSTLPLLGVITLWEESGHELLNSIQFRIFLLREFNFLQSNKIEIIYK